MSEAPGESGRERRSSRRAGAVLSLLLLALAVAWASRLLYTAAFFSGNGDAADYAAMGRNLARGEGFRSSVVYPLQLALFAGQHPQATPNLHRPPLLPLWNALAWKFSGGRFAAIWGSSALWMALAALVILRCGGPRRAVGLATAAAFLLYPPSVRFAASGMAEPGAALLCLALWAQLGRARPARAGAFAAGALAALATLLKYQLALLLPFLLFRLWRQEKHGRRAVAVAGLTWLLLLSPWLIRNARLTGDPFFTLQARFEISKALPGYELFRVARSAEPLSTPGFAAEHAKPLAVKSLRAWKGFFCDDWGVAAWPLLAGLAAWWAGRRRELAFWLGVNGALLLLLAPVNLEPRYLYATGMPLWAGAMLTLFSRLSLRAGAGAGLALLALLSALNLSQARNRPGLPDFTSDAARIARQVAPGAVVLTDVDSFVAWHADRPALWFPSDAATLDWLLDGYEIEAVYLQGGEASDWLYHFTDRQAALDELDRRFPHRRRLESGGMLWTREPGADPAAREQAEAPALRITSFPPAAPGFAPGAPRGAS